MKINTLKFIFRFNPYSARDVDPAPLNCQIQKKQQCKLAAQLDVQGKI